MRKRVSMDTMARDGDRTSARGGGASNTLPAMPNAEAMVADEAGIRARIHTVRGVQVMLDRDLALLYGVGTRVLNQAVKRHRERFPSRFMFRVDKEEFDGLKSQVVISSCSSLPDRSTDLKSQVVISSWGGDRALPYAFTEQGVAMLASVLRSPTAVRVSIQIMDAFVAMRKALASVAPILTRLEAAERRQIADQARNEERFDTIFRAMDGGEFPPQKVFFEGKHHDAWSFARKLVRRAAESIVLVDGYCDDTTLDILAQKRGGADVTVATSQKSVSRFLTRTVIDKFNKQNPTLSVRATGVFHDRFLILDGKELYHFGASLKDLGRLYCAVSKMDAEFIPSIMARI